ncbi:MAG: hypothetical protein QOE29_963, partial [Gaiellaceae bacterium]|nr:hypothetical protein [Gaiellaceae bacterium]
MTELVAAQPVVVPGLAERRCLAIVPALNEEESVARVIDEL